VTVLDNFSSNPTFLLALCHKPNFRVIRGDVRDEKIVKKALEGMDFIIPLAAIVGAPACEKDPVMAQSTNVGAIRLLNKIRTSDQKVIFSCTNSIYGKGQDNIYCTENTQLSPLSLYGRSKIEAENVFLKARDTAYRNSAISLRLATVFGASPSMRLNLSINNMIYRAVTDGYIVLYQANLKRNFIHILDVVRAFLHCIDNFEMMKGQAYNVGSSNVNMSKREICEEIKKQIIDFYIVEAEIGEDVDQRNYIVSNDKIEATGFVSKISLQNGITELIQAYKIMDSLQMGNMPKR